MNCAPAPDPSCMSHGIPPYSDGMRIGLLGGSFNPPHEAHRAISLFAMKRLRLDRIWWLVSPGNPLKDNGTLHTLRERVSALYRAVGLPDADAALVADTLVRADLWGHSSHGVLRAPWYLERVRKGVMKPVTRAARVVDAGAIAVVDGREGVGQVIARDAMLDAIARARRHGVGVVSVRNSNHHGALGYFTRIAAEAGCIGMLTANGGPAMAPWGGRRMAAELVRCSPIVGCRQSAGVHRR